MGALGIGSFWWVFLILAFLPILIRFLPGRSKKDEFIYITSLPKILDSEPKNRVHMIFGIAYAAWVFLMIALMRPIYYDTPIVIEQPHRDIILAVDLSDSMRYILLPRRSRKNSDTLMVRYSMKAAKSSLFLAALSKYAITVSFNRASSTLPSESAAFPAQKSIAPLHRERQ